MQVILIGGPMSENYDGKTIFRTIQVRGDQTLDVLGYVGSWQADFDQDRSA
jgi:hypothetical protein